jgi:hypothetical protein
MSHRIAVQCTLTFPPGPVVPIVPVEIPGGGVIAATKSQPIWTGFAVAGEPVTASTMLGVGLVNANQSWDAHGYDVETLGDGKGSIQGEWKESGSAAGSSIQWRIRSGNGVAAGIDGHATISCGPRGSDGSITCQLSGWYTLPPPVSVGGPDT